LLLVACEDKGRQKDTRFTDEMVRLCDISHSSFEPTYSMVAGKLTAAVMRADHAEITRLLHDIIEPLISSRITACGFAKTFSDSDRATLGDATALRMQQHAEWFDRLDAAYHALDRAVTDDEMRAALDAFHATIR
jgi:hypothetical protein